MKTPRATPIAINFLLLAEFIQLPVILGMTESQYKSMLTKN
jgi:hypothetical protein